MKKLLCLVFLFSTHSFAVDMNNLNYISPDGKYKIKNCGLMDVWSKSTAYVKCLPQISVRTNKGSFSKTVDLDLIKISGIHAKCFAFDYRNSKILLASAPSYLCAGSESDLSNSVSIISVDLDQTFSTEKIVSQSETINLISLAKYITGDKIFFIDDNSWIYFGMHSNNDDLSNAKTFAYMKTKSTTKLVTDVFINLNQSATTYVPSFSRKESDIVNDIDEDLGGGWRTPPKGRIDGQGIFLPN